MGECDALQRLSGIQVPVTDDRMQGPSVDCIIPCYNGAATVVAAIRSVLDQGVPGVRVIVVDDGSRDDSVVCIRELVDPRVILLTQPNRGPAAARNTGIRAAEAPFCAFLDADDLWLPGKLAVQIESLERAADPRVVGHCVSFRQLWPEGGRSDRIMPPGERVADALMDVCFTTIGSTLLVRRSVFETVGLFDESLTCFEDWDWQLRFLLLGFRFDTSPRVLVEKQEGRRRSGAVVENGVAHLRRHHEAIAATFGRKAAARFRAALAFEAAVARFLQHRWLGCASALATSLWANPWRLPSSLCRLAGRMIAAPGRDTPRKPACC